MKKLTLLFLFITNGLFAQICNCKCDSILIVNDALFLQLTMMEVYGPKSGLNDAYLLKKAVLKRSEDQWSECIKKRKLLRS